MSTRNLTSKMGKRPRDICLLCSNSATTNQITGIFNNSRILHVISKGAGVNIRPDPGLPDNICYGCIVKLNFYFDFQSQIRSNIKDLLVKYYTRVGDRKKIEKYRNIVLPNKLVLPPSGTVEEDTENLEAIDLFMASNFMDDNDDDNNAVEQDSSSDENYDTVNRRNNELNETSFLLEPMGETLYENASDTESGRSSYAVLTSQESQMPLQCDFCPKKYRKFVSFKKHMRIHCNERRVQQTKQQQQQQQVKQQKLYQCGKLNGCQELFKTLKELKNHERIHKEEIKCSICFKEFDNVNELNWHTICCDASKGQRSREPTRRTRSVSRRSQTPGPPKTELQSNSDDNNSRGYQTPIPKKIVNSMMPLKKSALNVDQISQTSSDNENLESSSEDEDKENEEDSEENEEDSDSSSDSETETENTFDPDERRRIHRRSRRLSSKQGKDYFRCSFITCSFGCNSLAQTMNHERAVHRALILYPCKECQEWFSTKENLIRHRKRHRAYFQNCINCHREFINNFELEHHMMQHHEKSYPCTHCPMSFLKTRELDTHVAANHHNETSEKQGIISRRGKPSQRLSNQQQFTGYKSKELIQKPADPTARKRKRLRYEVYRKKIGDVGRLCENDVPPDEYWVYGQELRILSGNRRQSMMSTNSNDHLLEEENLNIQREECTVPPSSFTDYSGSPVMFYKEENDNEHDVKLETIPRRRSPKHDSPEKFNLFSVDIIPESHENCNNQEHDWETDTNYSQRTKKSMKRKRRAKDIPIEIDGRYIPPYNVLFRQNDPIHRTEIRTSKEPFRYSG